MRRASMLASVIIAAALIGGFHEWATPRADAAASCDLIQAQAPALTSNGSNFYFKSYIHVRNCAAKTYLVTTLLVEVSGSYVESGCDGQAPPSCAIVYPTTGGDCDNGIHFCAYTNIERNPTTDPNGSICGRNFRSRVQVYSASGTFLGQDTSPTERC